jgi:hypothetical protein
MGLYARTASAKETFSVDYIVSISQKQPAVARIRWELSGIEEVKHLSLHFPAGRFDHFAGTGTLEPIEGGVRWVPGGPYAHLTYRATVNHARGQHGRYDSYACTDWVATRARDLFPRIGIEYAARDGARPKSRARLIFRVPSGWQTATAFAASAPNTYQLSQPDMTLDRPHGWFALGKLTLERQEIGDVMVEVARAPGSALVARELFALYGRTLPALRTLLAAAPQTILLVSAPDPMWHGGISAERSFFMHGQRPLRTPDKTSPYLHEMFHVLQPYRPAADADWIEEGLAEFYSLELQRRAGLVDAAAFARALGYFERFGLWNVDLTQQQDNAATGNSAPLVMYALDQRIQHDTAGKKRLDDVVHRLAQEGGEVDTSRFLHAIDAVSGKRFAKFFEHHVRHGVPPRFTSAP